ncbi:hypothetical protein VSP9026_02236 [Vibrio spartinae]|uniref:Uncharacterized protein n=1 Tax=Vibrio spartinae TaxID=1918945 RepID=A0A1N6M506_9VIBR|nr:hypothetical protein VSP9026_02236 [Vibrio spartinae]
MPLKPKNSIVRQNLEPEAGKVENWGVVIWCAKSLLISAASDARAPDTFGVPKVPKRTV